MREPAGLREYVAVRQAALVRLGYLLTGDFQVAEDLVQTALMRALPHWEHVSVTGDLDGYLYRTMVNTQLTWRRRRWRGERAAGLDLFGGARVDERDDRLVVMDALRRLPPRQRAIVVLRYYLDLSEAAIAETLGCAPGTVKSQNAKALASLRRMAPLADAMEGRT